MTTNNNILLESYDINAGIGLIFSEQNREFELHVFEGITQRSKNMKLSNEEISRLWHLLVPYFSDDFNE